MISVLFEETGSLPVVAVFKFDEFKRGLEDNVLGFIKNLLNFSPVDDIIDAVCETYHCESDTFVPERFEC